MDSGAVPMRCCFSLKISKYLAMYCAWLPVSTFFSPVLASY
ncbi:unnamed protein product [Ixodes persulcatus]